LLDSQLIHLQTRDLYGDMDHGNSMGFPQERELMLPSSVVNRNKSWYSCRNGTELCRFPVGT